jgi:hypothetical protein
MWGSSKKLILFLIFGIWLLLACEFTDSFGFTSTNPSATEPLSTFVPQQDLAITQATQPLTLESRHVSTDGLAKLELWVNDIPVNPALPAGQGTAFTNDAGNIQILVDAPHGEANSVKPEYPTNDEWTVSLVWIGYVPGTYNLILMATDNLGRTGVPITQRIEVKDFSP